MALFSTAYFGLLRIGELTKGMHTVLARDVHIGFNKRKFLFVLRTSKTHWKNMRPQSIKISSTIKNSCSRNTSVYCPYKLLRNYLQIRGPYINNSDQFFVFADGSPVLPAHMRSCLKRILHITGFRKDLYSVHSLRMGRALDLLNLGLSVETIKKIGRWRSNAVFKYLK